MHIKGSKNGKVVQESKLEYVSRIELSETLC